MSQFCITNYLTSFATLAIAIFVFYFNRKSPVNRLFCIYSLCISEWSFFTALHAMTANQELSLFYARMMNIGVPLIPILFFHFAVKILDMLKQHKTKIIAGYAVGVSFIVINFTTPLLISRVRPKLGYDYFMDGGLLYPLLIIYFTIYVLFGLSVLLKAYIAASGNKRNQLKYLLWGSVLGYVFGTTSFFPVYDITIPPYPFGSYAITLYVAMTAYAIIKYRLMNIEETVALTTTFIVTYIPIIAIPFIVQHMTGQPTWSILLATVLAPTALHVYNRAKGRVLTDRLAFQEAVTDIAENLKQTQGLEELLKTITSLITQKLKVFHSSLYLINPGTKHFERKSVEVSKRHKEKLINAYTIDKDGAIIRLLNKDKEALVYGEIRAMHHNANSTTLKEAETVFESMSSSVILPITYKEDTEENIIGVIALGERLSHMPYGDSEIKALNLLSEHIGLAIVNAQFVIKKEEKAVKNVAIGASHQMFNALAVVVTTIEVAKTIIDQKEMKDLTEEEARDLLDFAKTQIDIAVGEGHRSKKILTSILYEAKAKENFKPVDIHELITHVIGYSSQLKSKDFLEKNYPIPNTINNIPKDFPSIIGNEGLLRESFVNLLNNAYDAIRFLYIKDLPRDKSYKGTITIKAEDRGANIAVFIEDNGIGMDDYTKEKIFAAYYTTKGSDKGTGAGLFSLKGWIEKHSGNITFKTEYGKGATFIVELPKKQEGTSES